MAEQKTSEQHQQEFKDSLNSPAVETGKPEDETGNDENDDKQDDSQQSDGDNTSNDNNDTSENDSSNESGKDESDTSGEDGDSGKTDEQIQLEKAYSQFDVDGSVEGYVKRLERAYQKSSDEAIRLNHQLQGKQATGQQPQPPQQGQQQPAQNQQDTQETNSAPAQGEDPVLVHMRTQLDQQAEKDLQDFRKENPEIDTDPEIRENVNKYIKFYSHYAYQNEGRLPGMRESLDAAYKHFGYNDNKEEKVANQAKQNASQPKSGSKAKKGSSGSGDKDLTDEEKAFAQKMGRDPEKVKKQKQQAS